MKRHIALASLTLAPIAALAVGVGEAQLRSGYGQPLDVRIALMADAEAKRKLEEERALWDTTLMDGLEDEP